MLIHKHLFNYHPFSLFLLRLSVVFYQCLHRRGLYAPGLQAEAAGGGKDLRLEMAGDAAREMHEEVRAAVGAHVAAEEALKLFFEQCLDGEMVPMARKEGGKRGQEAVGKGRTVDALDNIGGG